MDANVTVWLDNLSKAARGEAAPPPSDTLLSIENRVKDATDDDLSGITSQLFGLHGLPEAIVASLDGETAEMRTPEKKELREAALRFLEVLVDEYTETRENAAAQIAAYAVPIVATCLRVFKLGESKEQELSLYPVLQVVELKAHVAGRALQDELFPEREAGGERRHVVDLCWDYMCRTSSGARRSTPTVRGLCYQLLGKLALLFPVDVSNERVYTEKRLFNSATADLRQQVGRADRQDTANVKEQLGVVAGALTALDGLLSDTDDLRLPEIDVVWSQLLRCLAINVGEIKRFNAPKAALELLGHRIDLFACVEQWTPPPGTASAAVEAARLGQSRLLAATPGADGRPADGAELAAVALWRHLLALSTHHNRNLRLLATEVLGIFLRRTSAQVCDAAELATDADAAVVQRARTIYGFLRGEVRRLAQRPPAELDAAELSTLLSAVGELAGPMRRFDGEAEVHTQLRALCELAAAVYQPAALRHSEAARRGADRGATSISAFVEAFARVLRHAGGGAVDALALRTLEQLVQLTFAQFKMMTVGQRLRNAAALQEVLVALDGRDGAQGALLSRAVFPALLVTIDGGRSAAHPAPAVFVKGF